MKCYVVFLCDVEFFWRDWRSQVCPAAVSIAEQGIRKCVETDVHSVWTAISTPGTSSRCQLILGRTNKIYFWSSFGPSIDVFRCCVVSVNCFFCIVWRRCDFATFHKYDTVGFTLSGSAKQGLIFCCCSVFFYFYILNPWLWHDFWLPHTFVLLSCRCAVVFFWNLKQICYAAVTAWCLAQILYNLINQLLTSLSSMQSTRPVCKGGLRGL